MPREAIAEELAVPRSGDGAFLPVYPKLEFPLQIPGDRGHRPLSRHFGSDVDIAVVSVAAEAMASTFQFPIELGQQDVG